MKTRRFPGWVTVMLVALWLAGVNLSWAGAGPVPWMRTDAPWTAGLGTAASTLRLPLHFTPGKL
jgi:hypothetical protein